MPSEDDRVPLQSKYGTKTYIASRRHLFEAFPLFSQRLDPKQITRLNVSDIAVSWILQLAHHDPRTRVTDPGILQQLMDAATRYELGPVAYDALAEELKHLKDQCPTEAFVLATVYGPRTRPSGWRNGEGFRLEANAAMIVSFSRPVCERVHLHGVDGAAVHAALKILRDSRAQWVREIHAAIHEFVRGVRDDPVQCNRCRVRERRIPVHALSGWAAVALSAVAQQPTDACCTPRFIEQHYQTLCRGCCEQFQRRAESLGAAILRINPMVASDQSVQMMARR